MLALEMRSCFVSWSLEFFYKWFPQMLPSFLPVVCSTSSPVTDDGVSVDRILGGGEGGKMVGTGKPITTSSVNCPDS